MSNLKKYTLEKNKTKETWELKKILLALLLDHLKVSLMLLLHES